MYVNESTLKTKQGTSKAPGDSGDRYTPMPRLSMLLVLLPSVAHAFTPTALPRHMSWATAGGRKPALTMAAPEELSAEIARLQLQVEIMKLQAQIDQARIQQPAPEAVAPPTSEPIVPPADAPPPDLDAVPTPDAVVLDAVPSLPSPVPSLPTPVPSLPTVPAAPQELVPSLAPVMTTAPAETIPEPAVAAEVVQQAATSSSFLPDVPLPVIAGLALVPVGYFGATKFVDFINTYYDGMQDDDATPPSSFAPPSNGNLMANRMWAEQQAEAEVARANSWYPASAEASRSAPEIFWAGVENLQQDPLGWVFGEPSALYSNAGGAPEGSAASTTSTTGDALAPASGDDGLSPVGSVVPTQAARRSSKKQRKGRRGQRVPPSTPEEVDAARRGEYDYYGSE